LLQDEDLTAKYAAYVEESNADETRVAEAARKMLEDAATRSKGRIKTFAVALCAHCGSLAGVNGYVVQRGPWRKAAAKIWESRGKSRDQATQRVRDDVKAILEYARVHFASVEDDLTTTGGSPELSGSESDIREDETASIHTERPQRERRAPEPVVVEAPVPRRAAPSRQTAPPPEPAPDTPQSVVSMTSVARIRHDALAEETLRLQEENEKLRQLAASGLPPDWSKDLSPRAMQARLTSHFLKQLDALCTATDNYALEEEMKVLLQKHKLL
jgi:hypothetical protein